MGSYAWYRGYSISTSALVLKRGVRFRGYVHGHVLRDARGRARIFAARATAHREAERVVDVLLAQAAGLTPMHPSALDSARGYTIAEGKARLRKRKGALFTRHRSRVST